MDMKTKVCTKCKKNKPLEDYYKGVGYKDGRKSECKSCYIVKQKKYNKSNKGKLTNAKATAKYHKSNKGKLAQTKYYKSDKYKLKQTKYQKSDKGKLAHVNYNKSDKGKAAKARANNNRRTKIANSLCTLDDKEFNFIVFTTQNNKCGCCGRTFNEELIPTRDHIIPVELGGDFIKENIQALCVECNSRKGVRYIEYRTDYHKEKIKII